MKRVGNLHQSGLPGFERNEGAGWRRSVLYRSSTRNVDWIGIHVSRLEANASPHSIESHDEEELVVVLDGQLQLSLCDGVSGTPASREEVVFPGDMVFHPSRRPHGQMSNGREAAVYVTFKWRAPDRKTSTRPQDDLSQVWRCSAPASGGNGKDLQRTDVFDLATRWLKKLHCHRSYLPIGAGYKPHADKHDVALVILRGDFQSSGIAHGPGSVLFHPAGYRHGLHNRSSTPCQYYAIEFHGHPRMAMLSGLQHWLVSIIHRTAANISASS
jgi:mannose-6-phosphate isomerase-like protein (cupin superfamily)